MALEKYRAKRDFRRTPEPAGEDGGRAAEKGLRYVVQKHDATRLHYDFRLELDGVLLSWAVPKGPEPVPGVRRLAVRTEDHPLDYADFEGVIPEGQYGAGTVLVWDRGTWTPVEDPHEGLSSGRLAFRLDGEKLAGEWRLVRQKAGREKAENWFLIKKRDAAARAAESEPIVEAEPRSVITGRDLAAVAAERRRLWMSNGGEVEGPGPARAAEPAGREVDPSAFDGAEPAALPKSPRCELATLVGAAPEGDDWLHEIKFDGYRILCRIDDGDVRLLSRNGGDWTARFGGIAAAAGPLRGGRGALLLDGEAVVLNEKGISDFQTLQNAMRDRREDVLYYAFDLLHLDGWDLGGVALAARKEALAAILGGGSSDGLVRYSDHVRGGGERFYREACELGLEGIVSKRADSVYRARRTRDWLKVKCSRRQEFVVAGFTDPSGSRAGFGSLILGLHGPDGRLEYAGRVGTGFTDPQLHELRKRLDGLERKSSPLADPPRGADARGVHWVVPELVAEVAFTEWTQDDVIRHPSFQGLREDKDPREVVREEPAAGAAAGNPRRSRGGDGKASGDGKGAGGRRGTGPARRGPKGPVTFAGVRLTSPERVLWPEQGVTKLELARYYELVADRALPHWLERPLTLVRCPSGRDKQCFYQKHANESVPETVPRVPIREEDGTETYLYVDGLPAIVALVQLGVLEFHVWGSRRDRLERPDRLVFDLDPGPDVAWSRLAGAARDLRERLDGLGLASFLKSTGGKGLHVVAPLVRRSSWEEVRSFAESIAVELARERPREFTSKMSKRSREGRIYVDYLRNGRNATAIAPYSARAREGAPVAAPLDWHEIDGPKRPLYTVRDVERLIDAPDPWKRFDAVRQSITAAMRSELGID